MGIFRAILLAVGVIAAATFFALALTGCEPAIAHNYPEWSADYDEDWKAVIACWGAPADTKKPYVIVRDDCRSKWGSQDFYLKGYEDWVFGYQHYPCVEVCPDLAALRHEFSHHVTVVAFGRNGLNGDGVCWL